MGLATPEVASGKTTDPVDSVSPRSRGRAVVGRVANVAVHFFDNPAQALGLVLLLALVSRAIWLWLPDHSLIFDEAYYVNAARVILGIHPPAGAAYAQAPLGLDPNTEHPPLGKLLIAGSMLLFGDNGIGWRLPSLLAGMVSLLALYGIVRAARERAWLGVLAVALFAFDNLSLVHGRIGTLDILFLAPSLVGAWLALRGHWTAAGLALAVGVLVKLTALFSVAALAAYLVVIVGIEWWDRRRIRLRDLYPLVPFLAAFLFVAIGGLWLLDLRFSPYHNPVDHIEHMLQFGAKLQTAGQPSGIASDPWSWLVNQVPIHYLTVNVNTTAGGKLIASRATIDFIGALNPVLLGALPLATGFALWLAWRAHSRLAVWALTWGGANYLVYYPMVLLDHRITYLYYMLPVVPALAVSTALLLDQAHLPRTVTWAYLAAFAVGVVAYFPFRQVP
jgi:dolichyl-phosphate-mannose-protein mannosyltransferase